MRLPVYRQADGVRRPVARVASRVPAALAALAALAGLGTLPALAPAGAAASARAAGGSRSSRVTITLYNGQHPETTSALVAAFEKRTGIRVVVRDGDEDQLADEILEEGGSSPADVFYSENSPALEDLQSHGLLAKVWASTLEEVPRRYDSPEGDWVGVSARVSGFVYNTRLLSRSQLPRSVLDLASPRYEGKLALAPTETDFQPVVTAVERAVGHEKALRWLEGLKRNAGSHVYPDDETLTAAVNSGQVAIGVVNDYYWYRLRYDLGAPRMRSVFAYFAPRDPGYVVDVSGAAVLRSSRHRRAAEELLAFLVSREGEQILAHSQSYEYPLGSGVGTAQPIRPFDELRPDPVTIAELGEGRAALALLQQAQVL